MLLAVQVCITEMYLKNAINAQYMILLHYVVWRYSIAREKRNLLPVWKLHRDSDYTVSVSVVVVVAVKV